jgi:hypothetical protein
MCGQVGADELTAMQRGVDRRPQNYRIDAGEDSLGLVNRRWAIEELDYVRKQCRGDQVTPRCQIWK